MKKLLTLCLLVSVLAGCKKEDQDKSTTGESGPAGDLTIHTYLGDDGYKVAYDTTVDGVYRDTFNWREPSVHYQLDNTEIIVTLDGSPVTSGITNTNGEYVITGLLRENVYRIKFKTKTFQSSYYGTYHYSADYKVYGNQIDIIKKYDVAFGAGKGRTLGTGSTPTPITNPWTE